ncbi:MAG TPA: ROK family protein, partial [Nordella sp.]|nr:ROK family protein [Nordella sp.]
CYCGNRGCLGQYLSLSAMRRDLAEAESRGEGTDAALDGWIACASEALSLGLATVENLFDPETIIIGGAAPPPLLERLIANLRTLRPSVRQDFGRDRLRLSTLGERSAALGASALPILAATTSGPANEVRF